MKLLHLLIIIPLILSSCDLLGLKAPEPQLLVDKTFAKERKKEIDSYTSNSKRIPGNFYSYSGFRDLWREPLIYPYAIVGVDTKDYCSIQNEWNMKDTESDQNKAITMQIPTYVTKFTFNKKVLAAETSENVNFADNPKKIIEGFVLFHFGSEEVEEFDTKEALKEAAAKYGIPKDAKYLNFDEYSEVLRRY